MGLINSQQIILYLSFRASSFNPPKTNSRTARASIVLFYRDFTGTLVLQQIELQ